MWTGLWHESRWKLVELTRALLFLSYLPPWRVLAAWAVHSGEFWDLGVWEKLFLDDFCAVGRDERGTLPAASLEGVKRMN